MFDKRLMKMCPESRKHIIGNILFQWAELIINAVMIGIIAMLVEGRPDLSYHVRCGALAALIAGVMQLIL